MNNKPKELLKPIRENQIKGDNEDEVEGRRKKKE